MKEQYIAEIQHNTYRQGEWCRVTPDGIGRRYFNTQEEAEAAIKKATAYFNGLGRPTTQTCGSIGITVQGDSKAANSMKVVKTRIRVRVVTEWETVTEE